MLTHLVLAAAMVAPAPTFTTAQTHPDGLWSDGDGLLAVLDYDSLELSCRTGPRIEIRGVKDLLDVDGAWVGGAPVVAAVGGARELVLSRGGRTSLRPVPAGAYEKTIAVAVDPRGKVVVLGDTQAVYRLDGERWDTLRFPEGFPRAVALAVRADGDIFVLGAAGELLRGRAGESELRPLVVPDLPPEAARLWVGPGSTLWVMGRHELAAVDVELAAIAQRVRPEIFGALRPLTGLITDTGALLAFTAQSTLALHDGKQLTRLPVEISFVRDVALDVRGAALIVTSHDGLASVPVDHPALLAARDRLGPAQACPWPAGPSQQPVGDLRPVPKDIPAPVFPGDLESRADRPAKRERPQPTLRVGLGPAFSPGVAPRPTIDTGLNLDVALGVVFNPRRHVYLWPELGYSYNGRGREPGHFVIAGLTPLFGNEAHQIGVSARLVAGDAWHTSGIGLRSGLVGSLLHRTMSLELGHQWIRAGGRDFHDARLILSYDMIMVFRFMGLVIGFGRGMGRVLRWLR